MKTRFLISAVAFCALPLLAATPAYAGSAAWSGQLNGNWNVFQNWSPQSVPNGPSDAATLGSSFNRTVYLSANTEVNSITFPRPAGPFAVNYGITVSTNLTLTISGVTINSNVSFTFVDSGTGTLPVGTVFTLINNISTLPIVGQFSNLR